MSLNKVITSVNALVNSVTIPDDKLNNVVCIDIENNRIGVKTGNPEKEIDISGTLKTNFIYINNINNSSSEFDVDYDTSFVSFSGGLKLQEDLSCENIICNAIDVSGITSDISFIKSVDIAENLKVLGSITTSEGIKHTSDDRYKHNEKMITNGLEIIRQLQPQTYDKTKTFKDIDYRGVVNEPHITEAGLIAQELNTINDISFAVTEGDNINPYYVRYDNVFIYGLAGIKELDNIVSNLSTRVTNMSEGTPDISDINLSNILDFVKNQNLLIQTLNNKITNLETRLIKLE
jgi:hypothetical protein